MIGKKGLSALLIVGVMASSVSTAALAEGHRGGGNGVAIAAGILGAVVVGSLIANSVQQPVYQAQPERYYAPPPQVYYEQQRQPVYYQEAPRYYEPQRVAYVHEYRERREYRERGDDHDGYYRR
jgi:uncharacterized membrane protein YeaQ/YmgE (transglycosylase-associated protein family)